MTLPSLKSRIRNRILALLALAALLDVAILPSLAQLGDSIKSTLYRNYVSIEAAQHMHADLWRMQLLIARSAPNEFKDLRNDFYRWLEVEDEHYTEVGEPELAHRIRRHADDLFAALSRGAGDPALNSSFAVLHARLDDLIEMNKAAMFAADSRANRLSLHLLYLFIAGLIFLLLLGGALAWAMAAAIALPLKELSARLQGVSARRTMPRLGPQRLLELDLVAREFNNMAERLEQYDRINVERLVYEKSKTEAIIESLEDGVVMLDPAGVVVHMNEIAGIVLEVEKTAALGCRFDDLDSVHPHYLRVRDALRGMRQAGDPMHRVEIELHVRGRDHSYVLKPIPLRHTDDSTLGTILILQDVTYLRDQDRARTNLVATLSHELKTPLTSLALSAELLGRQAARLAPEQRELVAAISEDLRRMRNLAEGLLDLARGEPAAIAVKRERLDLARLIDEAVRGFAIQAGQKGVVLQSSIDQARLQLDGDPLKLSWVISNLVGNALRYTPSGGRIDVIATRQVGFVRLEVVDTGPGIPPQIRNYVFERFAQYGTESSPRGSAGLGLAIVKEIVEAHDGRIYVESSPGQGTRFVVDLPAYEDRAWHAS